MEVENEKLRGSCESQVSTTAYNENQVENENLTQHVMNNINKVLT